MIANCVIRNNYAIVNGGGIYASGSLYLINSIVEDNTAGRKGPNIYGCCIDMEGGGCIAPFICADLPKSEESREYTVDTFEYKTLMVNVVGSETFSYQWYVTKTQGSTAGGVKVGINSPYYTPLGGGDIESPLYYYCVVTNDCGSDTSNVTGARTTSPPCYIPQITAQLNTDVQNRDQNVAFNALTVTATGDTPLTYQWYSCTSPTRAGSIKVGTNSRSYRPSSAVVGTLYYYCVVTNDCGTITSNVSGSHTVIVATGCVDETFNFGTVSFASANTRTITGTVDELSITQVWSDAVTATGCQKTAYNGGSSGAFKIDCRSNPSYPGDLFSWCAVVKYASTLCPAPWRVPTKDDFINLDKALGGTGSTRGTSSSELLKYFGTDSNQWGAAYGGYANADGTLSRQGSEACYRSQTEYSAGSGYYLDLHSSGSIYPQDNNSKYYGFSLRCVR